jgi:hypothetical protein
MIAAFGQDDVACSGLKSKKRRLSMIADNRISKLSVFSADLKVNSPRLHHNLFDNLQTFLKVIDPN